MLIVALIDAALAAQRAVVAVEPLGLGDPGAVAHGRR
jgi:hypothetical protein